LVLNRPLGLDSDKKRHSLASTAFRTLSLASPPGFLDAALVLNAFDTVKLIGSQWNAPRHPLSSFWATAGKFSVESNAILQ
jgi:hypothetical protein